MSEPISRVLLAIPAYNCAPQIGRVLASLTPEIRRAVETIVVVDNRSTDGTTDAARRAADELGLDVEIWRNRANYGLGGSHKVVFLEAERRGIEYVAVLHGDDQADGGELAVLLGAARARPSAAAVLGARFAPGSTRRGYAVERTAGNVAINVLFTIVTLRRTRDLGSGLNLFRLEPLLDRAYLRFDDSLTFNIDLLLHFFSRSFELAYVPISWREDDQVSNARNLRIGTTAVRKLLAWRLGRTPVGASHASYGFEPV